MKLNEQQQKQLAEVREDIEDFLIAFHQGEFMAADGLEELAKRVPDILIKDKDQSLPVVIGRWFKAFSATLREK